MRKYLVSLFIIALACSAFAQNAKKEELKLVSSQLFKGFTKTGTVRIIAPVFSHDGSTLAADSANYDQKRNVFDAFGNIVITQPNGTMVFSDLLKYNGNTKLAVLTRNVRLIDGDATLTTNLLTYNMGTKIGTYLGGGTIVNGQNIVSSKRGYYFANSRDAYFRNDVVVNSPQAMIKSDTLRYNTNNKIAFFYGPTHIYGTDDTLYTENGQYNTITDQAHFGKKNLYTQGNKSLKGDSLFYDRKAGFGRALGNITFVDAAENITFKGDIGVYRKAEETIMATKNAYVIITTEPDSAKVDSIYMSADTLFSKMVLKSSIRPSGREQLKTDAELKEEAIAASKEGTKEGVKEAAKEDVKKQPVARLSRKERKAVRNAPAKPDSVPPRKLADIVAKDSASSVKPVLITDNKTAVRDSVKAKPVDKTVVKGKNNKPAAKIVKPVKSTNPEDTVKKRVVMAYHRAKIFKNDLQAKADSMFFSYGDSIMRCYVNPMIWTQGSQLSGDTIYLQLKNKKLDNMLLQHNSFIVNTEEGDSTHFNQVRGKVITGVFEKGKLNRMFVDGNAESIYYVKEDSAYSGMNRMLSSRIKVLFKDSKLNNIISILKPEGNFYPMDKIPADEAILKGFIWKPKERPRSKAEINPALGGRPLPKGKTPAKKPAVKKVVVKPVTTAKKTN